MADANPFQPTMDDLMSLTSGMPNYNMVANGFAMGADPMPKPGLTGNMSMAGLPWWLAPFVAGILGRRGGQMPVAGGRPSFTAAPNLGGRAAPKMAAPANENQQYPMLDSPGARPRGGSPAESHVGRLNSLNPQQFQVYMDGRSRGMTPEAAMAAAQGNQ